MAKNDYKSNEEKKSELFGIITMIVVAVIFVAIIVFAVTNKTDKSDEETKVSHSEMVSIASESSTLNEQESTDYQQNSSSIPASQKNEITSSAQNNNSSEMQKELDAENSRFEAGKKRINDDYDNKIATQQNMKKLIMEKSPNDDVSQFDSEIERLESERKDKLDALQKTHNENINAIKAKY